MVCRKDKSFILIFQKYLWQDMRWLRYLKLSLYSYIRKNKKLYNTIWRYFFLYLMPDKFYLNFPQEKARKIWYSNISRKIFDYFFYHYYYLVGQRNKTFIYIFINFTNHCGKKVAFFNLLLPVYIKSFYIVIDQIWR